MPKIGSRSYARMQIRALPEGAAGSQSYDENDSSFEFVLATETPVSRVGYDDDTGESFLYSEVLRMSGLQNFDQIAGKPLLDSHRTDSVADILGRISAATVVNNELVCTAKLSDAASVDEVRTKIVEGTINSVSAGYYPIEIEETDQKDSQGNPIVIVTAWELGEASLVACPADGNAKIRSGDKKMSIFTRGKRAAADQTKKDQTDPDGDGDDDEDEAGDTDADSKNSRGKRAKRDDDEMSDDDTSDDSDNSERSKRAASKRAADIKALRPLAVKYGVEEEFEAFAATGASVEQLRSIAMSAMTRSSSKTAQGGGFRKNGDAERESKRGSAPELITFKDSAAYKRAAAYKIKY